jgi:hypothetical protein
LIYSDNDTSGGGAERKRKIDVVESFFQEGATKCVLEQYLLE